MHDAPVWAMTAVLVLAAYLSFAAPLKTRVAPLRTRVQLLPPGREAEATQRSSAATLVDPAADGLRDTAMMLELVASMLDAGAGIGRALELIAKCASPPIRESLRPVVAALAIGADWESAWQTPSKLPPEVVRLKNALAFAALTGAPSASILYAQAARERREQFRAAEKRAAALGVKLVVPLGLCSLPAFICLGIIPVLIAMLPSG
ncbi:type II secretion system F family protein [Paenarthrobacter aurescens]|uniref:Type II secretion system protein F n=1 Tax=Paenarthrobacter aurescens TaxID=43663 RepID=A0A4Y3N6X0_PAEAU|nr:type II secretion system F family protein [Paenarthrobacter aurescens]MDO6144721.1 type II secretion system F family protein [Paenarthrobacter aurescens]MDO6148565.1 type II secretion system F family protein [Paenarthrobacter aurescens]MDO6159812.1 type II secretion system F family protein [Paenarthrobacter aurescens]MDO6163675.1 type II secretion system F family protein [Paenarthrobacter aurescens]GEB17614.1 type II secretion system protein F [Paenarthrobacter aurescens]